MRLVLSPETETEIETQYIDIAAWIECFCTSCLFGCGIASALVLAELPLARDESLMAI